MWELDHGFICTAVDAPAGDRLREFGLREGSRNRHPGQGTANRRFFFHNFMLELLWVCDRAEAQSSRTQPTHLWERGSGHPDACPFGVCLRPASQPPAPPPFPHWLYQPPYLPPHLSIAVGTNAAQMSEPMVFSLAFAQRQDQYPRDRAEPLDHPARLREVTRLTLTHPNPSPPSAARRALVEAGFLHCQSGPYCLELGFDGETQGRSHDFQSDLPLRFVW
ncbi:MAG: hypothetical protein IGR92_16610 [Leptolyngbyaceae cyanobacterium T60_A2020_046]|nr:hypothetical protein [Leptolyngbyaceae cyanobacterium T60_A2020_046]